MIPRAMELVSEEGDIYNNVIFGAESSQSRSHVITTNRNFTLFGLTSIMALGSSSSISQSRWYVYLQVKRVSYCNGRVSGMIRDDKGE